MGIPGLIPILSKIEILKNVFVNIPNNRLDRELPKYAQGGRFQFMCFDLPGTIHDRTRRALAMGEYSKLPPLAQSVEHSELAKVVALEIVNAIRLHIFVANPESVIIAMDGPIPAAKMKQQRERRFKPSTGDEFNTNQITAGTPYMVALENVLIMELKKRVNKNELPNIIFLGQAEYGEGEHKIMNYLREHASEDRTQLIFGADTDFLIISLMMRTQIVLKREHREEIIPIEAMKDALDDNGINIRDWCILISLLGNDFLPHHDITTERTLMKAMVEFIFDQLILDGEEGLDAIVVRDEESDAYVIQWERLADFVNELSKMESKWLTRMGNMLRTQQNNSFLYKSSDDGITTTFINNWYRREIFHGHSKPKGISTNKSRLMGQLPAIITATKEDMCKHVCIGLQWILSYYTGEEVNPYWQYPYTYFPMFGSLIDHIDNHIRDYYDLHADVIYDYEQGMKRANIHTLAHRLTVLPPSSWDVCLREVEKKKINAKIGVEHYYMFPSQVEISSKDLTVRNKTTHCYYDERNSTMERTTGLPEMYYRVFAPYLDPRDIIKLLGFKEDMKYVESSITLFNPQADKYQQYQREQQLIMMSEYDKVDNQQPRRSNQSRPQPSERPSERKPKVTRKPVVTKDKRENVDIVPLYDANITLEIPRE